MATPSNSFLDEALAGVPGKLAIFGKHPSAADHLEDIGLTSASLVAFKQGFYLDGLGECLSKQIWSKDLGSTDAIPYDHNLLCVGRRGWLAVRFQHSSDAPGRRQFPLVLAVHGAEFASINQIADIGQLLESSLSAAAATREGAALRQIHAQGQTQLQQKLAATTPTPGQTAREAWLQGLPLAPDNQGLWRICHSLSSKGAGANRARVPLHAGGPWQSATLWLSLARHLFELQSGVISLVWKQGQAFGDLAFSPPNARFLNTLFTPESSQPVTSAVPFNVSPELRQEAQELFRHWMQDPVLFHRTSAAAESSSLLNKVRGWFKSAT